MNDEKRIKTTKYVPAFKYTKNINVITAYLENGTPEQRILALCRFRDATNYDPKEFDKYWEIFLSDENETVRLNALGCALSVKPKKCWEILDHLLNKTINSLREKCIKNDKAIIITAERMSEYKKQGLI